MFQSNLTERLLAEAAEVERLLAGRFAEIEATAFLNQQKVLSAFRQQGISEAHFHTSTGYGYDDEGRDALERVYAAAFGAEAALVRPQLISGTHAISTALFGVLRPKDRLLYISGKPYDTLQSIVTGGARDTGSLRDFGISYTHVDLLPNGAIDWEAVAQAATADVKAIAIQRSKGYADRPSLSIQAIEEAVRRARALAPQAVVFVDNCYGEFAERCEPTDVGADLIAGSLIKNPGGGLAKTGGYIAGRADLVERCAYRLTSPGIGAEAGANLGALLDMYQGFFLAPHVVSQALKGALFTACTLERAGMRTAPSWREPRTDLIQSVSFAQPGDMIAFCQAIQAHSPVNARFAPVPSYMPGYEDNVIMAAGTFVQGSSIELTADGPIRPPYTAYVQGGLTYEHVKYAVLASLQTLGDR